MMFERFTERARQVLVLAQDEARNLGHDYIGTEHILLGLLREEEGIAASVLIDEFNITVEEFRAQVAHLIGQGESQTTGQLPFTPRAKKVLDLSLREALALGHNYIGTEHVLLGFLREGDKAADSGPGIQILGRFSDPNEIREVVVRRLTRKPDKIRSEKIEAGTAYVSVKPKDLETLSEDIAAAVERGVLEGLRRALSRLNL